MERLKMYDKFIPERKGGIGLSDLCQPDKVWFGDKPDWFLYTVTGSWLRDRLQNYCTQRQPLQQERFLIYENIKLHQYTGFRASIIFLFS